MTLTLRYVFKVMTLSNLLKVLPEAGDGGGVEVASRESRTLLYASLITKIMKKNIFKENFCF